MTVSYTHLIVSLTIINILPHLDGFWRYTLVTKVNQVLNYQPGVTNEASSRMDSVFYVLQAFLKSPILGIGSEGYLLLAEKVGHSMFTCTPINWIARYGILYGLFIYKNLVRTFKKVTGTFFDALVALIIICISVFSEEYSTNIFFIILVFYGMQNRVGVRSLGRIKNENCRDKCGKYWKYGKYNVTNC